MNISIVGTGYVGLVTGVGLAEIGHHVTCIDIDEAKVEQLNKGKSPIYEPGIEELIIKNKTNGRLRFTTSFEVGAECAEAIYLAVGTPSDAAGKIDMRYFNQAASEIAAAIKQPTIIVVKSTVPVGTNQDLQNLMNEKASHQVSVVSNPEFLREGCALHDLFNGDRIVIGSSDEAAIEVLKRINKPFDIPMVITNLESAELIKYASNAFLATKISFINEMANLCEKIGADILEVSKGMGMDQRIGNRFLNAGIGYGGSCFPKDTNGLLQIANEAGLSFSLLQQVITVNKNQRKLFFEKLLDKVGTLAGKKVAVLGIAFKPDTDDIREAPALKMIAELLKHNAQVSAYDPIISKNKAVFNSAVNSAETIEEALEDADAALILTEWNEIKNISSTQFLLSMKQPIVLDGRNCLNQKEMLDAGVIYEAVGRSNKTNRKELALK
ncbi:UDP-glucose/GDP-mannose dehydrogenase family protein [Listeria sp. PSOL-1]|uniref:UDP-glucose dehydrogenase family protein n=1 Tax=Listeria sp. PSOL-1 TaxID=1844999 RepID=UPI0013D6210B|nr:UDP-glucose/GDP-mannose dehydrogenase family protein [Listeria sp. PSOL-1]